MPVSAAAAPATALVVAADSGPLLKPCVAALLASPQIGAVRVADNASTDGVPAAVAAAHADDPRLVVSRNSRNLGFGAAMNALAANCATPWLVLVNPDCELRPRTLATLLDAAAHHPEAGLVGALVEDDQGRVDPASCRRDPTLARVLADLGVTRGEGVAAPWPQAEAGTIEACAVEAVSGALMLVRRDVFAALGGFDTGYFLHFEDLDLCRRVRDAGHQVLLATGARVIHAKGTSSRHRAVFVAWHKHRGMWRWLTKFDPALRRPLVRVLAWSGIWLHFLLTAPGLAWRQLRAR